MVTLHENTTFELTTFETEIILPLVLESWKRKSLNEIVNMKDMVSGMNRYCVLNTIKNKNKRVTLKISAVRLRKIIHHIRANNLLPHTLIADSKGYYLSNDRFEIMKFVKSCRERANSFLEIAHKVERQI